MLPYPIRQPLRRSPHIISITLTSKVIYNVTRSEGGQDVFVDRWKGGASREYNPRLSGKETF